MFSVKPANQSIADAAVWILYGSTVCVLYNSSPQNGPLLLGGCHLRTLGIIWSLTTLG